MTGQFKVKATVGSALLPVESAAANGRPDTHIPPPEGNKSLQVDASASSDGNLSVLANRSFSFFVPNASTSALIFR